MRSTRRLRATLTVAAVGALVATGAALVQSPAHADANGGCRVYGKDGWAAQICLDADTTWDKEVAQGTLQTTPSNCKYFRVYVADKHGNLRRSSSAQPCTNNSLVEADADRVDLPGSADKVYGRLVAWDKNNKQILSIQSPYGWFCSSSGCP